MQTLNSADQDGVYLSPQEPIPYANQFFRLTMIRNEDQQSWQAVIEHLKSKKRYCFPANNLQAAQQFINNVLNIEQQSAPKTGIGFPRLAKLICSPLRNIWPTSDKVNSPPHTLVEVV